MAFYSANLVSKNNLSNNLSIVDENEIECGISFTRYSIPNDVSTLPYAFRNSNAIVYNNEIHILGSNDSSCYTKHYKFNGSIWEEVSTLSYDFYYGSAVVYNNEIHILGGNGGNYEHRLTTPKYVYENNGIVTINKI